MSITRILVLGSSNTDMVIKTDKFPRPGETILGGSFFMFPGGKGANQAVAAARLGGHVTFIAKVGNDIFGQQALAQFKNEGINTEFILSDDKNPSGIALITVDSKGENTIVVAQGSNGNLHGDDLKHAEKEFDNHDIVLTQLETPIATIIRAAELAARAKKKFILNPAPSAQLPGDLFKHLYIISPNRSETEALTGIEIKNTEEAKKAAIKLIEKGVQHVVITLGAEGAYVFNTKIDKHVPTEKVKAVDTTAAGDVFNGALAVALSEGAELIEAVGFANRAAALSVTKMGAQSSAPYRSEMNSIPLS